MDGCEQYTADVQSILCDEVQDTISSLGGDFPGGRVKVEDRVDNHGV